MKKLYHQPIVYVCVLDNEDVVRTSVPEMFDKNPFLPSDFDDNGI